MYDPLLPSAFYDDLPPGDVALFRESWFPLDKTLQRSDFKDVYDTKAIEPYIQGVELTRQRQYDAGVVKIHAGEPRHRLRQNRFGMEVLGRTRVDHFLDNDRLDPVAYIRAQEGAEDFGDIALTYPFYVDGEVESEGGKYDGVIEPLTIRPILDRSSIDAPFEPHATRGEMMGSSTDPWGASAQILNVDLRGSETGVVEYDDREFFPFRSVKLKPFVDARVNPLGDTDSYVSPGEVSATAGWHFDGASEGTDSIAFGGRRHFAGEGRRTLPRLEIDRESNRPSYPLVARTGDVTRLGRDLRPYNDTRALVYDGGQTLNYPAMVPTSYLSREGLSAYGGGLEAPGKPTGGATEQFLSKNSNERTPPFVEHNRPEQSPSALTSPYFMTGSSVEKFGFALSQGLRSKTQIKMEFPIKQQLQMLPTSSAIYYYNSADGKFQIPQIGGAKNDIDDAKNSIDFGIQSPPPSSGWTTPPGIGKYRPEDARGFGPIGNQVSSGSSLEPRVVGWASDDDFKINTTDSIALNAWSQKNRTEIQTRLYEKSISNNKDYVSLGDETFVLPIRQPFLLEKAVFEIPLKAGPGWLNDRTVSSTPVGSASFDVTFFEMREETISGWFGAPIQYHYYIFWNEKRNAGLCVNASDFAGPAITVSIWNQIPSGTSYCKDLVLTGTIIPSGDNSKNVVLKNTWTNYYGCDLEDLSLKQLQILEPQGFLSFGATPSCVIEQSDDYFTGSALVRAAAAVSNGPLLSCVEFANYTSGSAVQHAELIDNAIELVTSPYIDLKQVSWRESNAIRRNSFLKTVDVFGRNAKGAESSGRSLFGNEFVVPQNQDDKIPNPLYVAPSYEELPLAFRELLDPVENPDFRYYTQFVVPITQTTPSPYLVMPGDKLTLALSKMRPALASNGYDPLTGLQTLDIFRDGLEHDVCIDTGSIKVTFYGSLLRDGVEFHDTLNQPLNTEAIHETIGNDPVLDQYDVEYASSLYGTYVDDYVTGSLVSRSGNDLVAGKRGKFFSKLNAREVSYMNLSQQIRRSELSVFPFEKVSTSRAVKISSQFERIYDTLMPNIVDIIRINGADVYLLQDVIDEEVGETAGLLSFNRTMEEFFYWYYPNVSDNLWTSTFPFEERYSSVKRQLEFYQGAYAKFYADSLLGPSIGELEFPVKLSGFWVARRVLYVDQNALGLIPLSDETLAKVAFGIGDNQAFPYNVDLSIPDNDSPAILDTILGLAFASKIRGWKYGIYNALPQYTAQAYRRDRYGQFRDMLEQRIDTAIYLVDSGVGISDFDALEVSRRRPRHGQIDSPVKVKFVDAEGNLVTDKSLLMSYNTTDHAVSGTPYFDRDEETFVDNTNYNQSVITFTPDLLPSF